MVKKPRYRLGEIAERLGGVLSGDPQLEITGLATLQRARADQLAFLSNPGYRKYLATSDAGAVILNAEAAKECPLPHIVVADPYLAYAKVSHWFDSAPVMAMGIDPSAKVSPQAHVATTACIGPFAVIESGAVLEAHAVVGSGCYVGQDCVIGAHSRLHPQVVLYHGVRLGRRVIIHSQAVIGADGFGFARSDNAWHKIAQIGSVIIGDDVEIGAGTTIDRGAIEDTVIENGVKLDNGVQVAHNVKIGEGTAIAAGTGISGSTVIGRRCTIGGAVGIGGHLTIADDVHLTGMAMVTRSISKSGAYSSGTGMLENLEWRKNVARFRHLDEMARRLRRLEEHLAEPNHCLPQPESHEAMIDVNEIKEYLPQRYPFLLVDRVTDLIVGESINAYKNVTVNEHFFEGHFASHPVMPGVLVVEALAQAAGILGFKTMNQKSSSDSIYYFAGIDDVRFKRPVVPGDRLDLFAKVISSKKGVWKFECRASVGDQLVCEGTILCAHRKLTRD